MPPDAGHGFDGIEERQRFFKSTQHQLIRVIGGGSYGKVWIAQSVTGAYRAVKVVFRRDFKSDIPYEREYKGILKFEPISRDHDGFIDILHVGRDDEAGYFYYIMELGDDVESGPGIRPESYQPSTLDLQRRLHRRIPFATALQFSLKLTLALGAMHKTGLVHRDIKPQNIIFVNGSPKLADIGLVTDAGLDVSFVGTEGYIPREGPGKPTADIYSLGKSLYEITTGNDRMEFPELPEELLDDPVIGPKFVEFNEVLVKACETEPANRYQTAEEMHAHLALLQAGKSVRRLLELERWRQRVKRYLPAALVSAAAIVALFFLFVREQQRQAQARQERAGNATGFANSAIRSGDYFAALPWLTDALEADAGDRNRERDHRLQLGSVLQHSPRVVQRWLHGLEEAFYVTSLQFRPDSEHVLLPDTNGLWAFYDLATGQRTTEVLATRPRHDAAKLSADARRAVFCGFRSGLEVWDFDANRVIFSLDEPSRVRFATFNPEGTQLLLALRKPPFAEVIDIASGAVTHPFEGLNQESYHFNYSPDCSLLLLSSRDGVRVWDTQSQSLTSSYYFQGLTYESIFYPDGSRVATCSNDKSVRVWNPKTSKEVFPKILHNDGVASVDVSPDGKLIASGSWDRTVRLWDAKSGKELDPPMRHNHRVMYVKFCPKGCHVLSATYEGILTAWQLNEAPVPPRVEAAFSADGRRAAWITNGVALLQDLATGNSLGTVELGPQSATRPILSDDGAALLVRTNGPDGERSRLWDVLRREYSGAPFVVDSTLTNRVLSPNGRYLAAYTSNELQAIDTLSGEIPYRFKATRTNSIRFVTFSHLGRYVAIATNHAIVMADLKSGRTVGYDPVRQSHLISWIEFSPDDELFVTTGANSHFSSSYAQIVSTTTGRPVGPPLWQTDGIYCARFSPDGTKLVTTSEDFTAIIWDVRTGSPFRIQRIEHGAQIAHASFSSDNRWLVTAGRDSAVRIWDVATGNPLTLPFAHPTKLRRAHFAANDTAIVTRSDSGRTWYWKLPIEAKPLPDLVDIANLLASREASYIPPQIYMTNETFRSTWQRLHDKYPEEFGAR